MFSDCFRFFWPPTVTCTMCDFAEKYPKTSQKWVQNESKMRILSQKYSFFIIFLEFVDESANRRTAPYALPMTSIWVPMMIWGELECFQIFQVFWTSTLYCKRWNYDPQNTLKIITFWAQNGVVFCAPLLVKMPFFGIQGRVPKNPKNMKTLKLTLNHHRNPYWSHW